MCLLGRLPDSLRMHTDRIQSLLVLARKTIMTKWIGTTLLMSKCGKIPGIWCHNLWETEVLYCRENEFIFEKKWEGPLELLGIMCSLSQRKWRDCSTHMHRHRSLLLLCMLFAIPQTNNVCVFAKINRNLNDYIDAFWARPSWPNGRGMPEQLTALQSNDKHSSPWG